MRILLVLTLLMCLSCGRVKKTKHAEKVKEKTTMPSKKGVKVITKTEDKLETKTKGENKIAAHSEDAIDMIKVEKTSKNVTNTESGTIRTSFDHNLLNTILQTHVSVQGKVDYKSIKSEWNVLRN